MQLEFVAHFELEVSYTVGRALVRIDGDECPSPTSFIWDKAIERVAECYAIVISRYSVNCEPHGF